jgi:RecB family exonuclease
MNPVIITEPLTIRQTHLRWIEDHCPAGAWALAVERREGPTTPGADRGTAVHDVFSRYVEWLWSSGRQTDWEMAEGIAREVVAQYSLTFDQRQDVLDQARNIAEGFIFEREHYYGTEEQFETTNIRLHDGRPVTLTGRIDLLMVDADEGVARITDAKSNHQIFPDSRVAEDFQLKLYALLVLDNMPHVDAVEGSLYLTRYGITLPQKGAAVWTRDEIEEFRSHLRDRLSLFYAGKLREEFVPGTNCQYCPRRRPGDCARWSGYSNTTAPPIRTFYQARRAAGRVIALEQERETLLEHLKDYVRENGPLQVGPTARAETFAFHEATSEEFDAADVLRIAQSPEVRSLMGDVDLNKLLSVNRSGATFKNLRKHEDFKDLFADVARAKKKTAFSHKVVDDA